MSFVANFVDPNLNPDLFNPVKSFAPFVIGHPHAFALVFSFVQGFQINFFAQKSLS